MRPANSQKCKPAVCAGISVVAIFGPTAVGKSETAIKVAAAANAEIVSADSMQIYQGLAVITDQPSPAMLRMVPHHLVAEVPLGEEYSAAIYRRQAGAVIEEIAARGKITVLTGGTGLYARSLLGGFSFAGHDAGQRGKWQKFIEEKGKEAAVKELKHLDPEAAAVVDLGNPRRLARALEAAASEGASLAGERSKMWAAQSPYRVLSFGLETSRDDLNRKIDMRVDKMLESGAIEEVAAALKAGISQTASKAIGVGEIKCYLERRCTLEEAAAAIKSKSRRYAKRQFTWMRKMPDIVKIDVAGRSPSLVAEEILYHLRRAGLNSS